jgi:hypothetical protein
MRFARASHTIRLFEFLAELARRNVIRVGLLYLTCCWVILEPIHVVFHMLEVPLWANQLVLIVLSLGLPVALIITWLFELTPSGVRPTVMVDRAKSIRGQTGRRMDRIIIVILALALVYMTLDKFWLGGRASPTAPPRAAVAPPVPETPQVATAAPKVAPLPAAPDQSSALGAGAHAADAGQGTGALVTILDGSALVIRGNSRFMLASGVQLTGGDILAIGADSLAQLELEDGTQIALGPMTSLMLLPAEGGSAPRALYLLSGWTKVTAARAAALDRLRAAYLEVSVADDITVTHLDEDGTSVFAELGNARIVESGRGGARTDLALKHGQFYSRRGRSAGTVLARPSAQFLQQVPAAFRDPLPSRFEMLRTRSVALRPAPDFTYADVAAWLKSDSTIRRQLVERWKDRARDPGFRKALEANLRDLPEWRPILYPPPQDNAEQSARDSGAPSVATSPPPQP